MPIKMVLKYSDEYQHTRNIIQIIAPKIIDCHTNTLRTWLRRHEHDIGSVGESALTTNEHQRLKELEHEDSELCRAHDILRQAYSYIAQTKRDHHWKK